MPNFVYSKLLQSNDRKCLRPYQCDNLFMCPMMRLKQHLSQGIQSVLHFRSLPSTLIDGEIYVHWTLVFLRLIVRPNEHAYKNWLSSICRSWAEWATSSASLAKRRSRIVTIFRFHFALRLARLKCLLSVLVWSLIQDVEEPKASFNSIKKKIPNRVGASTHTW